MSRSLDLSNSPLSRVATSRAGFLRGALGLTAGASIVALSGCGSDSSGGDGDGELKFLGWQGYDNPEAAKPLSDKGTKISAQYITANDDIITKLRGGTDLDVVTPFVPYVPALVAAGLLQELDYDRLPNTKSQFPELLDIARDYSGGKTFAVPIVWSDIPMVVRPELMPELPESWLDLRDPKYKGKLVTLDDAYQNLVIISRAVNGPDGASMMTQKQFDDVVKVWKEIKPNIVSFAPSFGDSADILKRGDAAGAVVGWRFMQQQLKDQNVKTVAHTPSEGTFAWLDTYAIPKNTSNVDLAYSFIDTMISANGNALVADGTGSAASNKDAVAKLPAEAQKLYPYDNIAPFFEAQYPLPLEEDGDIVSYDEWIRAWEDIKLS